MTLEWGDATAAHSQITDTEQAKPSKSSKSSTSSIDCGLARGWGKLLAARHWLAIFNCHVFLPFHLVPRQQLLHNTFPHFHIPSNNVAFCQGSKAKLIVPGNSALITHNLCGKWQDRWVKCPHCSLSTQSQQG